LVEAEKGGELISFNIYTTNSFPSSLHDLQI